MPLRLSPETRRKAAGLLLAFLIAGVDLAWNAHRFRHAIGRYDRYSLPGFDAYVYMAMADGPAFFTVAPWGYRILTPWAVHLLPGDSATAFRRLAFGGLVLAGGLLYLFLRRLGHGEGPSLLAVLAFGFLGPVLEVVRSPYLTEPLTLCLELCLLLALEAGAGAGSLSLVLLLGTLSKEEFLLFAPVVAFARRDGEGWRTGVGRAVLAAGPAALVLVCLHRFWAPNAGGPGLFTRPEAYALGLYRILAGVPEWWRAVALQGLMPLAFLGALRPVSRPFLARYGFLLLVSVGVAFAASIYSADAEHVPFFPTDIPRLLLYALPLLLPLGLTAVDRAWPHREAVAPPRAAASGGRLAWAATLAIAAVPFLVQDRYRRVVLQGPHDGRLVLALCRGSLAFAGRLERGKPIVYNCEERRYSGYGADPHFLEGMRWFLREGWGLRPQYGTGPLAMQDRTASVLVPCFKPADWTLVLTLSAPEATDLRVSMNGRALGDLAVGPEPARYKVRVSAGDLFRGDNELRLDLLGRPEAAARLRELAIRPVL